MGVKQKQWWSLKIWLLGLFAIVGISFSLHSVVFADYPPTGGKCDDGSAPTTTTPGGSSTPIQTCADSTKKAGSSNPPTGQTNQTSNDTNAVHCAVEKIGWIICPVMQQAAKISDKGFEMLADNFLSTDPELVGNQSGTKTAWEISRNIANIMFVIAFLIIIISQVTGKGIDNYGLKKMIPRLLVAALLVNVSYYICQLVVDLTNILGYEIEEAMVQISNNIGPSVFGQATQLGAANVASNSIATWGGLGQVVVESALAAAAVVWLIMGPMMAVITMIIITLLVIIVILMLRKALIVLLIVASPIAFVLYLLPNTEKLFSKWKDMFVKVLFLFPVIGLLFGAGQLAGTIILTAGAESQQQADAAKSCNPDDSGAKKSFQQNGGASRYDSCGMGSVILTGPKGGDVSSTCGVTSNGSVGASTLPVCKHLAASWTLALVALGVTVAPLIAVWSVLKGALAAAGSVGNKINATIAKGQGSVLKRAEAADTARQNRMALRAMQDRHTVGGTLYRRRARRDAIRGGVEKELKGAQQSWIADEAGGDASLRNKMAGGAGLRGGTPEAINRVEAAALNAKRVEENEATKAAADVVKDMRDDQLTQLTSGDIDVNDPKVAAAIHELGMRQNFGDLERILNKIGNSGPSLATRTLSQTLSQNAGGMFSGGQIAQISSGRLATSYMDTVGQNLANGLAPEKLAGFNNSLTDEASRIASTSSKAAAGLKISADKLLNDDILKNKVSGTVSGVFASYSRNDFRQIKDR